MVTKSRNGDALFLAGLENGQLRFDLRSFTYILDRADH
jgi:hypothetical protein